MASQASIDRIRESVINKKEVITVIQHIDEIEDIRQFKVTIDCHNQNHEKCISTECCCTCHKPEVEQMSASKEILEPKDWSMDRKKAYLEKIGKKIPDEFLPNSEEESSFINNEFNKLDFEEVENMTKKQKKQTTPKTRTPKADSKYPKLSCSKCDKVVGFVRDRQIKKFGSIEEVQKKYICSTCRKK